MVQAERQKPLVRKTEGKLVHDDQRTLDSTQFTDIVVVLDDAARDLHRSQNGNARVNGTENQQSSPSIEVSNNNGLTQEPVTIWQDPRIHLNGGPAIKEEEIQIVGEGDEIKEVDESKTVIHEGAISQREFLKQLGIGEHTFIRNGLGKGMIPIKIGNRFLYTPEQQRIIRSRLASLEVATVSGPATSLKTKEMSREVKTYVVPEGYISRATLVKNLGIKDSQFHNYGLNRLVTPTRIGNQNFYSPEQAELIKEQWAEIEQEKLEQRQRKTVGLLIDKEFAETMDGSTEQNSNDLDLYALHLNEIGQIPIEIGKHKLWGIQISSAQMADDTLLEVLKNPKITTLQREQIMTVLENKTVKFMTEEFQHSVESSMEDEVFDNIFRKLEEGNDLNEDNEGSSELFIHTMQNHGNWVIRKLSEIDTTKNPKEAHAKLQKLIDHQVKLITVGKEAHDQLVGTNMRLVVSIAKKYRGSLELADAAGYGYEGLMRAASRFDWRMGFQFSTYATWWIRQSITRAVADYSNAIRLPVHVYEELGKITKVHRQAVQDLGTEISIEDFIDSYPNLTSDTKKALKQAVKDQQMVSLSTPVGDEDESELGDLLEDKKVDVPEEAGMFALKEEIEKVLGTLTYRERKVLRLRFGIEDGRSRTLEEVGNEFSVTRERIRQIEAKAMRKLRHPSRSRKLRAYTDVDPKSKSVSPGQAAGARTFRT